MTDSNVDVDTDNLDDFSATFFGTTKPAVEAETEAEVSETPSATEDPTKGVEEESKPDEGDIDGDDAPATEEDEDEAEETPKPKGRKPARERINELTRQRRELERERDAYLNELKELKSKSVPEVPVRQATPAQDGSPNPDDVLADGSPKYPLGEFDPAFIGDLTRFVFRQEAENEKKKTEETRAKTEQATAAKEILDQWTEKVQNVAERLPDLADKVVELEDSLTGIDPQYGEFLASTIMSLEYGPDVLNYLADNPDEARKIVDSGPTKATIALGRLEARFIAGEEVEKGKIVQTQAPTPPPRNKGSAGRVMVAADTDDLEAFEKQFFSKKK